MSNIKYNTERLHNEADFGQKNVLFEAVARKKTRTASDIRLLIFSKTSLSSITYMNFQKTENNFNVKIEENCRKLPFSHSIPLYNEFWGTVFRRPVAQKNGRHHMFILAYLLF